MYSSMSVQVGFYYFLFLLSLWVFFSKVLVLLIPSFISCCLYLFSINLLCDLSQLSWNSLFVEEMQQRCAEGYYPSLLKNYFPLIIPPILEKLHPPAEYERSISPTSLTMATVQLLVMGVSPNRSRLVWKLRIW